MGFERPTAAARIVRSNMTKAGSTPRLRLTLIGGFMLVAVSSGSEISIPHSAERLVALLALSPQPLQRAYVAGTLWPDTTQDRAAASLRSTLWRLKRSGESMVRATPSHLGLSETLAVDVRNVEEAVHRLIDPLVTCSVEELEPDLLMGELLPDWHRDDWALLERERLRQLCLHGLDAVCERFIALGRYGEAAQAALAAIRVEPLRESAHRLLITIHLAEGNQSEVLRSYRWYERLLRDELRIAPSQRIIQLVNSLRPAV